MLQATMSARALTPACGLHAASQATGAACNCVTASAVCSAAACDSTLNQEATNMAEQACRQTCALQHPEDCGRRVDPHHFAAVCACLVGGGACTASAAAAGALHGAAGPGRPQRHSAAHGGSQRELQQVLHCLCVCASLGAHGHEGSQLLRVQRRVCGLNAELTMCSGVC